MKLDVYACQCCGCSHSGDHLRVPGFKMGKVMFERMVCRVCFDRMVNVLGEEFWGKSNKKMTPGCCARCGDILKGTASQTVHESLREDGSWKLAKVCLCCFPDYIKYCNKAMENKHGN